MKKLASVALGFLIAFSASAQGVFNLSNGTPTVDAPIRNAAGAFIGTTGFWIQAYTAASVSSTQTADPSSLTPLGSPFRASDLAAGYFFNGTTAISGIIADAYATVQIRAWSDGGGTLNSYSAAAATPGAQIGASNLVNIQLAGGTGQPRDLTGLSSINLTIVPVPEPGVIALAIAGAGMLFFRRRK